MSICARIIWSYRYDVKDYIITTNVAQSERYMCRYEFGDEGIGGGMKRRNSIKNRFSETFQKVYEMSREGGKEKEAFL